MAVVSFATYKENPMIVLKRNEEDRFPFQFGLSKARLIVDAYADIKAWVDKEEAKRAADTEAKPKAKAKSEPEE